MRKGNKLYLVKYVASYLKIELSEEDANKILDKYYFSSIVINPDLKRSRTIHISSKSPFFNSRVKCKITYNSIIFERPTDLYNGPTFKPQLNKKTLFYQFTVTSENEIPNGMLFFDTEESTDEKLIFYYQ
jgi:hypothetical protein